MARFGNLGTQYFTDDNVVLGGGSVTFYEPGTTTLKATYSDSGQSILNTNPVLLDAAGRLPNVFFSGLAKAVLKDSDGEIIQTRDPVGDFSAGDESFSTWSADVSYSVNDVVAGSDGYFYVSRVNSNIANDPISSPTEWKLLVEQLGFDGTVNGNVYVVDTSDGQGIGNVAPDRISPIQLVTSATASTTAVIDFTNLNLTLYNYRVVLENLVVSGDTSAIWLRTSTDNGSAFDSGGTDYGNGYVLGSAALGAAAGGAQGAEIIISGTNVMRNAAGRGAVAEIFITKANASSRPMFKATFTAESTSNEPFVALTGGWRSSNDAINAIRLLPSAGTFSTGNVRLYRESKS
jgi:hypothetical protein